jgi:hypothetical protein
VPNDLPDWSLSLPWVLVGSFTTVGAGAESFTTPTLPFSAQSLGFLVEAGAGITGLQIHGHQSGGHYFDGVPGFTFGVWRTIPINASIDTTYDVSWLTSVLPGTKIDIFACAAAMPYPGLGQSPMASSVPVTIATDQPQFAVGGGQQNSATSQSIVFAADLAPMPWMAPQFSLDINNPASGAVLIAAVAGQIIRLHTFAGSLRAAVAAQQFVFRSPIAGAIRARFSAAIQGPHYIDFKGLPLPVGQGMDIFLTAAMGLDGTLTYSQG